ncbi:unnamed protein product [Brassica napus]|uniref:ADP-ribosyl cyclase/cyclic ADP-ribose hydrolase n=1 Tax=Brassica napus TaxID=3708 RepID=A0A816WE30_BRANA|nr:unnamed protein product [Brassica napus]
MASSSSLSRSWLYHVFLSFRGEDVRKGFLSHVLKELKSKGIIPFVDNEIKRGESVGPVLVGAIRQSRVAVVLLSRNYASSSWCLDELVEIMKFREQDQQTVMTIFYEVDPSHVRKQTGDFGKAFDETCVGKTEEVKQEWRQALKDVAGIAGYHSSNCDSEADLINKVASDVMAVLGFTPSKDFDDFVGVGAQAKEIKSKLILQSEEVKVIALVGPAGIGKTTTARVLYNQLSPCFPFNTFLENIRGSYEKPCGNDYQLKLCLHKNLLSQLFNQKEIEVRHLGAAQQMLSDKKVLVVLDEVDSWWQLEEITSQRGWFGPRSIIIITTEDRKLLKTLRLGIDHIYEMKFPIRNESLQIFCHYAFGQKSPDYGFESLAWEVTGLAGDLPLGLRVMGSYLRGMSREEWIDALPRLKSSLDREIESTLRLSYDGLSDKDKALFLHCACFFSKFPYFLTVDRLKRLLEKSSLDVNHGLQVLAYKSLIYIEEGSVRMHRLLQKMAREIVKKQCLEEPGKRQFLMDTKDISDVLEENTGTGTVLGIQLIYSNGEEIQTSKSAFDGMNNLQFLKVESDKVRIPEGLNCLPDKLRLIDWNDCPLIFWPSKFSGKFLVELIMRSNKFEKLWEGIKPLQCLKRMDLSFSKYLKEIPDLSKATSLEELDLSECKSLLELTSSISNATKLRICKLKGCLLLKELPSSIGSYTPIEEVPSLMRIWSCLYKLDMSGCTNLKEFPDVPDSIVELVLCGTEIEEVPSWIGNLSRLRKLIMYGCKKLKTISPNISKLENLVSLCLSLDDFGHLDYIDRYGTDLFEVIIKWGPAFERGWTLRSDYDVCDIFPKCLPEKALTSPISLEFVGGGLETIPNCIGYLSGLSRLTVGGCVMLDELPGLPSSLQFIDADNCESLRSIRSPFLNPNICLNFANCYKLNPEARNLIETSACKYAFLPGEEMPVNYPHRATSRSLTINLPPRPLPSSFRFRACILLSYDEERDNPSYNDGYDEEGDDSLSGMSYRVRGKQNGHTVHYVSDEIQMTRVRVFRRHLHIFEDSFSLNHDCPEAEETTFSELSFVFIVHSKAWKVEGCGVRLLEEVPLCIPDVNIDDDK